jgi:hypothetical protein
MVSELNHEHDLRRAWLLQIVASERERLITRIDELLQKVQLTPNRTNGLLNSLAWHERRRSAVDRLRELAAELARLADRTEDSEDEHRLYTGLAQLLNLERPLSDQEFILLRPLRLTDDEREQWTYELRLLLAQTAIEILQLLADSRLVRQEIIQNKGDLRWR